MLSVQSLKSRLKDRNVTTIANETGLSRATISAIKNGGQDTPSYPVLEKLSNYFASRDLEDSA